MYIFLFFNILIGILLGISLFKRPFIPIKSIINLNNKY